MWRIWLASGSESNYMYFILFSYSFFAKVFSFWGKIFLPAGFFFFQMIRTLVSDIIYSFKELFMHLALSNGS